MVMKDQVEDAKNLLKNLNLSYSGINLDKNLGESEAQDP
jgi:hypothetical protein